MYWVFILESLPKMSSSDIVKYCRFESFCRLWLDTFLSWYFSLLTPCRFGFLKHRPEPTNFLIKCNASVNAVDKVNRNSPLHCAVLAGNVDAVHILIEAGASVDLENANVSGPHKPLSAPLMGYEMFIFWFWESPTSGWRACKVKTTLSIVL